MCVHTQDDTVSGSIIRGGRWGDCDQLSTLWTSAMDTTNATYVEIGGNIGACVMHMLLVTDALDIRVFEPNPANLFCLTSTLLQFPEAQRKRVTVYPFALGELAEGLQIFGAKHNMGNSVVGKIIQDGPGQEFNAPVPIRVDRYDDVIGPEVRVALMKMDAQGFECNVMRGMGERRVEVIKTEIANHWLSSHPGCDDKILFGLFKTRGMDVFDGHGDRLERPSAPGVYDVVVRLRELN